MIRYYYGILGLDHCVGCGSRCVQILTLGLDGHRLDRVSVGFDSVYRGLDFSKLLGCPSCRIFGMYRGYTSFRYRLWNRSSKVWTKGKLPLIPMME